MCVCVCHRYKESFFISMVRMRELYVNELYNSIGIPCLNLHIVPVDTRYVS